MYMKTFKLIIRIDILASTPNVTYSYICKLYMSLDDQNMKAFNLILSLIL